MLITEFYENQEILITGGTGFIGKALIEKLLRSCSDVARIYVLIRSKKGKSAEERLRDILNSKLFNRLHQEQPGAIKKVCAIEGDCGELGLGIKAEDLKKLQNVTLIFHSAASVRFDDPLRSAILLNTRGTLELCKIAETFEKLKVFIHISTTYCYPDKKIVEEEVYPPYADWRTTIKLAETYDENTLNIFNLKYSGNQPNTYTFTKSLAEQIIMDYKDKLPLVIFRPSIVISSLFEPVAGWVDNFNGPFGMLVACGLGILRTNYGNPNVISDFVPVDIVVRTMLIACYKKGIEAPNPNSHNNSLEVFNAAAGGKLKALKIGDVIEFGKRIVRENPFEKTLWLPGGKITQCPVWNFIKFITLQIFMAVLVDCILRIGGAKPFLLKLQRRIYAANMALHVFIVTEWTFKNEKLFNLDTIVPKSEHDKFAFLDYCRELEYDDFIKKGIRGAKEFLLNEPPESSAFAHLRIKIFFILHYGIQLIILLSLLRYLYMKYI